MFSINYRCSTRHFVSGAGILGRSGDLPNQGYKQGNHSYSNSPVQSVKALIARLTMSHNPPNYLKTAIQLLMLRVSGSWRVFRFGVRG